MRERKVYQMELRTAASPKDVKYYTTERLREEFLIEKVFFEDEIRLVYSHIDRIITGAAMPVKKELKLEAGDELRAKYFLREERWVLSISVVMGLSLLMVRITQLLTEMECTLEWVNRISYLRLSILQIHLNFI